MELSGLGRREPCLLEELDDLVCELPLVRRKHRGLERPVQTSTNVRMDPRTRCELVSELVQLAHLLEQRLELHVVDRHDRAESTSLPRWRDAVVGDAERSPARLRC